LVDIGILANMSTVWDIVEIFSEIVDCSQELGSYYSENTPLLFGRNNWDIKKKSHLKFHPASCHLYFLLIPFNSFSTSWKFLFLSLVSTLGCPHIWNWACSQHLLFGFVLLVDYITRSEFFLPSEGEENRSMRAGVKWWLLMLSPLNICLVLAERTQFPHSLVTIKGLPKSVPESGLWGWEEGGLRWGCDGGMGQEVVGSVRGTIWKNGTFN